MDVNPLLHLLITANQLKTLPRTGWLQRGVPGAENVAAHSFGVVLATLLLLDVVDAPLDAAPLDAARALAMATLHDLPEALTSDIPSPVRRFFPQGDGAVKTHIERMALREIVSGTPFAAQWEALWEELHREDSAESRLVQDADKLDLFVQAYLYEQQTGSRRLAEFWAEPHTFYYPAAQALYDTLRRQRAG